MKRRWVPIPVDDPEVTHVHAEIAVYREHEVEFRGEAEFPVPPDDRLGRAIRVLIAASAGEAISRYEASGRSLEAVQDLDDAIATVEAAFQLGEEGG